MSGTRKLHIKSYGGQMNVYDSQRMTDTMVREGFVETAVPEDADLVVLNTCHIREKAAEKVYSELGRIRRLKEDAARDGRQMIIAVAGCVAQAEGEEIIRRAPMVDVVLGPQNYHPRPKTTPACPTCWRAPRAAPRSPTRNFRSRTSSITSRRRAARRRARAASRLSSPCRRAATSSAPSASCRIPAVRKSRGRSQRSSRKSNASPRRACAR